MPKSKKTDKEYRTNIGNPDTELEDISDEGLESIGGMDEGVSMGTKCGWPSNCASSLPKGDSPPAQL